MNGVPQNTRFGSSPLSKIISNSGWIYGDRIFRAAIGLFVGAWLARYLGPSRLGLLTYAQSFVALFYGVASLGVDSIFIRNVVMYPEKKFSYLGTAFVMRLAGSVFSLLAATIAVCLKPSDTPIMTQLVMIIAIARLFGSFDIIDLWFQSQVCSKYSVVAKNSSYIITASVRIFLIVSQASLIAFAWAIFLESLLTSLALVVIYIKKHNHLKEWRVCLDTGKEMFGDSWPLLFSGATVMVNLQIDKIMLGEMLTSESVGVYTAAVTVSEAWYIVPMAVASSVFPSIINAKKNNEVLYLEKIQKLYDFTAFTSLVIAAFISFFAYQIIELIYGSVYSGSAQVLVIHVWSGVFLLLASVSGRYLNIENLTIITFYRGLIGAVTNIVLNMILIPCYGIKGAAFASLISYSAMVFSLFFFSRSRSQIKPLIHSLLLKNYITALIKRQV